MGAAVGAGVDAARSAAEAADSGDTSSSHVSNASDQTDETGRLSIPHLYAPGELLYLCCPKGALPSQSLISLFWIDQASAPVCSCRGPVPLLSKRCAASQLLTPRFESLSWGCFRVSSLHPGGASLYKFRVSEALPPSHTPPFKTPTPLFRISIMKMLLSAWCDVVWHNH